MKTAAHLCSGMSFRAQSIHSRKYAIHSWALSDESTNVSRHAMSHVTKENRASVITSTTPRNFSPSYSTSSSSRTPAKQYGERKPQRTVRREDRAEPMRPYTTFMARACWAWRPGRYNSRPLIVPARSPSVA